MSKAEPKNANDLLVSYIIIRLKTMKGNTC